MDASPRNGLTATALGAPGVGTLPLMLRRLIFFALFVTTAAGSKAQWQLQDAHTTADLRGIDNVGGGVAWASGSDGTILRTEDAGFVWQLCAKPPGGEHLDFRGIQAFDNNTAIVMSSGKGDLSRLYKTTDGCQSWKLIFINPDKDGFWDALSIDKRKPSLARPNWQTHMRGFILGDPVNGFFVIYTTDDSCTTWSRWRNDHYEGPAHAQAEQTIFAASNSAALASEYIGNLVFVTGGDHYAEFFKMKLYDPFDTGIRRIFEKYELPMLSGPTSGAFSLAVKGDDPAHHIYVVVGGDYAHPNNSGTAALLPSPQHGIFGSKQQKAEPAVIPPHGYRSAVAYDEKTNTWITVGPNGTDISTDDGRNWRALKPDPKFNDPPDADQHWNALSLPYAVGPHGRIGVLRPSALKQP